jgi:hypothetical protein
MTEEYWEYSLIGVLSRVSQELMWPIAPLAVFVLFVVRRVRGGDEDHRKKDCTCFSAIQYRVGQASSIS